MPAFQVRYIFRSNSLADAAKPAVAPDTKRRLNVRELSLVQIDEIALQTELLVTNCNGQYFIQNCVKCGLSLKIWCTEWKACPKCGAKNYGKHYGA